MTYDTSMPYMYLQALYIKQTFCNENMTELEYSKQYTGAFQSF